MHAVSEKLMVLRKVGISALDIEQLVCEGESAGETYDACPALPCHLRKVKFGAVFHAGGIVRHSTPTTAVRITKLVLDRCGGGLDS